MCLLKKIVIDRDIPYINGVLECSAGVVYRKGVEISAADVVDADVLIVRTRTRCDRELLEGSSVRMIATATIGFDHIDMEYCAQRGIHVMTSAGCNARGVLQWVSAVLALRERTKGINPGRSTLGVVGVGHVGSLVAEYAQSWGFRVLRCDPPRQRAEGGDFVLFSQIVEQADIITFHVPMICEGVDATYHLAGGQFFDHIKQGALILNSSRGGVVDENALLKAAQSGRCSYAIDTWESEPTIDYDLVQRALTATTHIAGYSAQGKAAATRMVVHAVAERYGLPLTNWLPSQVHQVSPRPIEWSKMLDTITQYFDIEAQSAQLKNDISQFENIRNNYTYRSEYF